LAFKIQSTTEKLESVAGLILAGEIARSCGLQDVLEKEKSRSNALVSMFGLLVQGRTAFEEIDLFRRNSFFKTAFNLTFVPAQETLRLYLEKIAKNTKIQNTIQSCSTAILKKTKITPVAVEGRKYIPVDIDVSVMDNSDSQKEGVGKTYMLVDGYAPIFSYIGTEGYMLDCELRPGSQHCQKGTPGFLRSNLKTLEDLKLSDPLLFRLDGGNDGIETMLPLVGKNRFFLIKRNLRKESREAWLDCAQALGTKHIERQGKAVYTGSVTRKHPKADQSMGEFDIVFQVTERTIDCEGNDLLFPDIEVETWWTNLFESPEDIIALYHNHGTCEQFHSELKSDMGVERLPSGKFKVNALILKLAMLAFNTLRLIGQRSLEKAALLPMKVEVKRKRLRKVISDIMNIGCKFVRHGHYFILRISDTNPWLPVFRELYAGLQV
jgi:hypothetical protein